ncbi:hypothetical protein HY572_07110 [Candidatus Micrarchaeota archaeon]|nr:hypothetical protein [Candidatus Micrarchaeota archaeon]
MKHPVWQVALRTPVLYLVAGLMVVLLVGSLFGWFPKPFDQIALALFIAGVLGLLAASRELRRLLEDFGA